MFYLIKNDIMFGMGGEAFSSKIIAKSEEKKKLTKLIGDKMEEAIQNDNVECIDDLEKEEFMADFLDNLEGGEHTGHVSELKILYESDGFDREQERYYVMSDKDVPVI